MSNREKVKIVIIVACIIAGSICIKIIADINYQNRPYSDTEESSRGFDSTEDDVTYLNLDNSTELDTNLPAVKNVVVNQILQKHYELTKKLERQATLSDYVQKDNRSTFNVTFQPDGDVFTVSIVMRNITTKDYDFTMEKK